MSATTGSPLLAVRGVKTFYGNIIALKAWTWTSTPARS